MPLYEYQCDACGTRFERIRKFSDPPLTECPNCGADGVRKLVSSPAFTFKGSGWYVTDYAKKSGDSSSSSSGKGAADSAGESKTDAKADAPKDAPAAADKPSGGSAAPGTAAKDKS